MTGVHVAGYAVAISLLIAMPGADFAVVVRNGLAGGRRAASAAGLGIAAGLVLWSLAVATGLAAVLAASSRVYLVLKLAGAVYLLVLGLLTLRSAARGAPAPADADPVPTEVRWVRSFRQGFLTNALNPKVAITFLAVMPQFLPSSPAPSGLLVLSGITVVLATAWFQVVAAALGGLRSVLLRDRMRRGIEAATGAVLLAFGLRVAVE